MLQDDLEDAERLAREALESPQGPGASSVIAMSYQVLGSVRYRQGLPAEALELVAEGHRALTRPMPHRKTTVSCTTSGRSSA